MTATSRGTTGTWMLSAALAVLAVFVRTEPVIGSPYLTYMACLIAINIIATIWLNIPVG